MWWVFCYLIHGIYQLETKESFVRKYIFVFLLGAFILPYVTFASFDISLSYGAKGQAVTELQNFLQDQKFLIAKSNGYFGPGTLKAVKAFQKANGINPLSGYFGPATRIKANSLIANKIDSVKTKDKESNIVKVITPIVTPPIVPPVVVPPVVPPLIISPQDLCKNIDGIQATIPSDMYVENGNCLNVVKQEPGIITFLASQYTGETIIPITNVGILNQTLWETTASVSNKDMQITSLKLRMIGSVPYGQVKNLRFSINENSIASQPTLDSEYLTFSFSPVRLNMGATYNFKLIGDIDNTSAERTIRFSIEKSSDINITEIDTGQAVTFYANSATNSPFPITTPNYRLRPQ